MVDPNLSNFITSSLAQGTPKEIIAGQLIAAGWDAGMVEAAWIEIAATQAPAKIGNRIQKSTLWLWSTLWLTTTIYALLVGLILGVPSEFAIRYIPSDFGSPALLASTFSYLIGVIGIVFGSYMATHYVLKHSIVLKRRAGTFAILAILIPLIGIVALFGAIVAYFGVSHVVLPRAFGPAGISIISLSLMYGIIRSRLERKGD